LESFAVSAAFDTKVWSFVAASDRFTAVGRLMQKKNNKKSYICMTTNIHTGQNDNMNRKTKLIVRIKTKK